MATQRNSAGGGGDAVGGKVVLIIDGQYLIKCARRMSSRLDTSVKGIANLVKVGVCG